MAAKKQTKDVLILLGSPREDGNSTRLAYAFADAASLSGHRVNSIRLPALAIAPCQVCNACRTSKRAKCVLADDMMSVYPLLKAADVLVFATPLHFFTWSSWMKAAIDRLYCAAPDMPGNLKGKMSALLATAADDRPAAFAGLKATYRLTADYMGWTSIGEVLITDVDAEGDIDARKGALQKAARLAAKI